MYKYIKSFCCVVLSAFVLLQTSPALYAQEATTSSEPSIKVSIEMEGASASEHIIQDEGLASEKNLYSGVNKSYPRGTKLTLTAKEKNCEFLFWKDVISSKILSYEKTYTTFVGSELKIKAVFRSPSNTGKLVIFQNKNGQIIKSSYVREGSSITVPATPSMHGYTFDGWYLNGSKQTIGEGDSIEASSLTSDSTYIAEYTAETKKYAINVTGGSGSGNYTYNNPVFVTLDEEAVPEGKYFSHWANGDEIISYDKNYTFYAGTNANISAVYKDDLTAKTPTLSIDVAEVSIAKNKIAFLSQRTLPLDYEFVETGILMSTSPIFDLSTTSASKVVATSKEPSGQFCACKARASFSNTWYAKAYMIYKKDGVTYVMYSNVVNASTNI